MMAMICLGGIGWLPDVFWHRASVMDIVQAVLGYCHDRHIDLGRGRFDPPSIAFMQEMLAQA